PDSGHDARRTRTGIRGSAELRRRLLPRHALLGNRRRNVRDARRFSRLRRRRSGRPLRGRRRAVRMTSTSKWGARAAELYNGSYADRYRDYDDRLRGGALVTRFGNWLRSVCDRFSAPIDALDLGCGTGRYFHALRGVRRLVGIDVSEPMLKRALTPVDGG